MNDSGSAARAARATIVLTAGVALAGTVAASLVIGLRIANTRHEPSENWWLLAWLVVGFVDALAGATLVARHGHRRLGACLLVGGAMAVVAALATQAGGYVAQSDHITVWRMVPGARRWARSIAAGALAALGAVGARPARAPARPRARLLVDGSVHRRRRGGPCRGPPAGRDRFRRRRHLARRRIGHGRHGVRGDAMVALGTVARGGSAARLAGLRRRDRVAGARAGAVRHRRVAVPGRRRRRPAADAGDAAAADGRRADPGAARTAGSVPRAGARRHRLDRLLRRDHRRLHRRGRRARAARRRQRPDVAARRDDRDRRRVRRSVPPPRPQRRRPAGVGHPRRSARGRPRRRRPRRCELRRRAAPGAGDQPAARAAPRRGGHRRPHPDRLAPRRGDGSADHPRADGGTGATRRGGRPARGRLGARPVPAGTRRAGAGRARRPARPGGRLGGPGDAAAAIDRGGRVGARRGAAAPAARPARRARAGAHRRLARAADDRPPARSIAGRAPRWPRRASCSTGSPTRSMP